MSQCPNTSLAESIRRDRREMMDRRTVDTIMAVVDRFIPYACQREAVDALYAAVSEGGYELTHRLEREQYEAWKRTFHPVAALVLQTETPGEKQG